VDNLKQLLLIKEADAKAQHEKYRGEKLKKLAILRQSLAQILQEEQCFRLQNLTIDGNDLLQIGMPEGEQIGLILNKLLAMVLEGEIANDKGILLAKAKALYH